MIMRQTFDGAENFASMLSQVNGFPLYYGNTDPVRQESKWTGWSYTKAPSSSKGR